jgi:hypothetical protein
MSCGYALSPGGIACPTGTAHVVLALIAAAGVLARLTESSISFDGVSGTAVPVKLELCEGTGAGAGTTTGSVTPRQVRGLARTVQCTAAYLYTAEPTVLTVLKTWYIHPQAGQIIQLPLGREYEHVGAGGFYLRALAGAAVNCAPNMEFEEG